MSLLRPHMQTYHPVYAPPPPEVQARLVWRLDDTPEVVEKRCFRVCARARVVWRLDDTPEVVEKRCVCVCGCVGVWVCVCVCVSFGFSVSNHVQPKEDTFYSKIYIEIYSMSHHHTHMSHHHTRLNTCKPKRTHSTVRKNILQ